MKKDYLTEDEIQKLLAVVAGTKDDALIRFGLETAAKASGIRSLRLSSLRMNAGGTAVMLAERGMDYRTVNLSRETASPFHDSFFLDRCSWESWRQHPRRSYGRKVENYRLFPFSKRTLNRRLQKYAEKARIKRHVHWGMLKDTCIIRLLKKGMSFKEIAETLLLKERSIYLAYREFMPTSQELEETIEYRI